MIENALRSIQNIIDNINGFVEPLLYEIQRYALTYPDAFKLVVILPILIAFEVVAVILIAWYMQP